MRRNKRTGQLERHFKVRISGSRSSCWTAESDLPTAVVKLYDDRDGTTRAEGTQNPTQLERADGEADEDESSSEDGDRDHREDIGPLTNDAASGEGTAHGEVVAEIEEGHAHVRRERKVCWADEVGDALESTV